MLSQKLKRNILRILPFVTIWVVFGILAAFIERGVLGSLNYIPSTGSSYDFRINFFIHLVFATTYGLIIGFLEVFIPIDFFAKRGFGKKILYKLLAYISLLLFFTLLATLISLLLEFETINFDERVWDGVISYITSFAFFSKQFYAAVVLAVSLFYSEISENIGQGILRNFFTGKYHNPKEEERIFMFLDIKSSTTIAENIGHINYFKMLKEYYSDLSDSIIQHRGEIYQYVGDEVIISWKLEKGIDTNNCIQCFFSMKQAILNQAEKYNSNFGLVPSFKAGIHYGKVTTGEIGALKKEIIFTGDVLNSTARIQQLCNTHHVDLLVSGKLIQKLNLGSEYNKKSFGSNELRGKKENMELFTISLN